MLATTADQLTIAGLVPFSTTDWPDKIVATVFLQGCPLRCVYCHNPDLIDPRGVGRYQWRDVQHLLRSRRGLLDGVVFSGGEPTRQPQVVDAIRQVAAMGFAVGLHTCGAYPAVLREAAPNLAWIGLDIKAPRTKYEAVTGRSFAHARAWESLDVIQRVGMPYEVRITLDPTTLTADDVRELIGSLRNRGVRTIALQEVRPVGTSAGYAAELGTRSLLPDLATHDPGLIIRHA